MKLDASSILKSERILLRPVTPDDYRQLFDMHTNSENLYLWWNDRYILDFETFIDDLRNRLRSFIDSFFVIERFKNEEQSIIGFTYSYKVSHIDKHAYICVYLLPEFTSNGYGPEGGILFCNYLFKTYGFRKLYLEVFSYNAPSIRAARKNNFKEEATISDYHWYDNKHWDLHIFSITMQAFMDYNNTISAGSSNFEGN